MLDEPVAGEAAIGTAETGTSHGIRAKDAHGDRNWGAGMRKYESESSRMHAIKPHEGAVNMRGGPREEENALSRNV